MGEVSNDVDIISVVSKSSIRAKVTIKMSDGSKKSINISEGDKVKNLSYVSEGSVKTVSGEVKVIGYNIGSTRPNTNNCVHATVSDFSKKVALTNLVIDCSEKYSSDLRTIPFAAIRDFDTDDAGEMVIANEKYANGVVTFTSTVKPAVVIWNDEVIIPTQNDPSTDVYIADVNSMKDLNILIVLDADNRVKTIIEGVEPTIYTPDTISVYLDAAKSYVKDTLYNKYTNNDNVNVEDNMYYVEVAADIGTTNKITINEEVYNSEDTVPFAIGGNSFVNKPVFKITDNKLRVGTLAIINLATEDGELNIGVNGYSIPLTVSVEDAKLTTSGTPSGGGSGSSEVPPASETPSESGSSSETPSGGGSGSSNVPPASETPSEDAPSE